MVSDFDEFDLVMIVEGFAISHSDEELDNIDVTPRFKGKSRCESNVC
jgi:hypothetical protein